MAVSVEADDLAFLRHVHLRSEAAAQLPMAVAQLRGENVGHGDEFDGAVLDAKRIFHGARAASAASHQRELNRIVLLCMYVREGHSGQGRNPGDAPAVLKKGAARRSVFRFTLHGNPSSVRYCLFKSADMLIGARIGSSRA